MAFGENLKRLRGEANLTQEALAERLGVSRSTVAKWEAGAGQPKPDNLVRLRRVLLVPVDALLLSPAQAEETALPPVYRCGSCKKLLLRCGGALLKCPICGIRAFIGEDGRLVFEQPCPGRTEQR